uniref:ABC transporter substrate-binding protein n=1 Tax=Muribaculaceae bacterium Z82 TaxID=2304548 RepID=A0A7C9NKD2_9BACT
MKKKFAAVVACVAALALSVAALAGCSGGSQESTDGTQKLIVGFDQGYPPYGYVDDSGQFAGFDLDLAQAVADKNGWEVELVPIDWDAKDALLGSGAINCIWNGFTMEGREDGYTFSDPYMLNEQVVVVKADSGINSLDDLAGKVVMTQVDSAALDVLQNDDAEEGGQAELAATFKDLQTIGDYNNAFMQLESGAVDAVACDLSIAAYQMAAKPDVYKQLGTLSSEHYAVGFAKGNDALAKQVTDALKQLDEEGAVQQLCDKYADQGITYDNWVL